ncbi:MAG: TIGR00730 family Rossman fold protein [Gemmatimonadota bacterium]
MAPDTNVKVQRICVFCGSSAGEDSRYLDAASELGAAIAQRGLGLVYGGSRIGLMGRLAQAVLDAGGEVTGVMPRPLMNRELVHAGLHDLVVTESMHERKAEMAARSDAFVAAPGGLGTFEEFFEILTWAQLGFHRKPCGILNASDYYGPLTRMLDHAVREGFVQEQHRKMILVEDNPQVLLDRMGDYQPPEVPRWIEEDEI